jgi:hypothetical protein
MSFIKFGLSALRNIKGIWEQGAEESIWILGGWRDRQLKKYIIRKFIICKPTHHQITYYSVDQTKEDEMSGAYERWAVHAKF